MGRHALNLRRARARKRRPVVITWLTGTVNLDFEGAYRRLRNQIMRNA